MKQQQKTCVYFFSSLFLWQTFNALLVIRVCTKFFVERLKEEDVFRQFCAEAPLKADGGESEKGVVEPGQRFQAFIDSLIGIISDYPTT